ncbi:MAG: hypothetical protein HY822_12555 [Acidobacteria bacterium]|nr:hypothetical protein [Acidobacteriota bacterium]
MNRRIQFALIAAVLLAGCGKRPGPEARAQPPAPSRFADLMLGRPDAGARRQAGFAECNGSWCMTSRVFRFTMDPPAAGEQATFLEFDFILPEELTTAYGEVTLTGRVNGIEVGRRTYRTPARYAFTAQVPEPALKTRPAVVEFELDKSFKDGESGRVQGLVAVRASLLPYEATDEYRVLMALRAREEYKKALDGRRKMPAAKLNELDQLFRRLPAWDSVAFHGIPTAQNPLDLWTLQQIIFEVRPEWVIEIGTGRGGAALYFAQVLAGIGLADAHVLTVDPADQTQEAAKHPLWGTVIFLHGQPGDPKIVERAVNEARGKPAVVAINFDGSEERLLAAMRVYGPLVSAGSYLVVGDTRRGGRAAIERFLREPAGQDFTVDASREMFITTWNAGGWLKRNAAAAGTKGE